MTKAVRHDLRSLRKVVFAIEKTSGPPRLSPRVCGRNFGAVNGRSGKRDNPRKSPYPEMCQTETALVQVADGRTLYILVFRRCTFVCDIFLHAIYPFLKTCEPKERGLPRTDIGAPDGKKLKVDIRLSCWQEC